MSKSENTVDFSAKDICLLMRTARACGVLKFSHGELTFELSELIPRKTEKPVGAETPKAEQVADEVIDKLEQEVLEEATRLLREAEIEQLSITDPEKYEELVSQGELVDEPAENDSGA